MDHHPATAQVLQYFDYAHLPPHLQQISAPFHKLANALVEDLEGPEVTVAIRKLLEAKDAAVRAAVTMNKKEADGV